MSRKKSYLNEGESLVFTKDLQNGRLYNYLKHICKNRYRWDNLPVGLESRFIEDALYNNGQAMFIEDSNLGFLCLPCTSIGNLNVYNEPTTVNITGVGYNKTVNINDGVRILDNEDVMPPRLHIKYYADLLEEIETTIRLNLEQQKFPFVIPTSKANERSMKTMFDNFMKGLPLFIDEDSNRGESLLKAVKTDAPFLLLDLMQFKDLVMSEVLTYLGINNTSNGDKKERLLVDEVNINNLHVLLNYEFGYMYRKLACEKINNKFGLNITVTKVIQELDVDFKGQLSDVE